MSRTPTQQGLMPSMLDRLIDPDTAGTAARQGYGIEQMVNAVRRDLEDLLNTRAPEFLGGDRFPEVRHSIVTFGLPDLNNFAGGSRQDNEKLSRAIEEIVARFEPRLKDIHVAVDETVTRADRTVRFHINARLSVDPAPEVAFETILNLTTGQTRVEQTS